MASVIKTIGNIIFIRKTVGLCLMVCVLLYCHSISVFSQQVPVKIQAVVFKKVFLFVKSLRTQDAPRVLIVYNETNIDAKDDIVDEFTKLGVATGIVKQSLLSSAIASYNIVFVLPGCASVKGIIRSNNVLSITSEPSLVERGDCSISLDEENGKPKIVVNISTLKAEGQEVSSELLKLSRIIQ